MLNTSKYFGSFRTRSKINFLKTFLKFVFICGLMFLVNFKASAQKASQCSPPDIAVALYNFVPEAQLQNSDFRPLMKTESGFLNTLQQATNIDLSDYTTPILPADIQPDLPRITSDLDPSPKQIPESYFFTGQITRSGNGFLLTVELKKCSDESLLNTIKTPFENAEGAEDAGKKNAAAMLVFFDTYAQNSRDNQENSDHAINPHLDLIIDKLQLKPNETSPVKIVLTDCDGVRLKHRTIEAFLQLKHGETPVQEENLVRITDEKGERNGIIGAKEPGVITYIVKFKYKDVMGVQRELTESKTIVISGDGAHLWQMRADVQYENSTLYYSTDLQSNKWSGRRYSLRKKASMVFVFKANDSDPSGDVSADNLQNFNGFGQVYLYDKTISDQESAEVKTASGMLNQSQSAMENIQPGFSISPGNNDFQVSLNNIPFTGTSELFAVRIHPYNNVHRTEIEFSEGMGAECSCKITPEMKKSGIYRCSFYERVPIDTKSGNGVISRGSTTGYELKKYDFEVRRVSPGGKGLIK